MNTNTDSTGYGTYTASTDERFFEVRRRRMMAFIADYLVIAILTGIAAVAVFFLGILTFGLAWLLYFILAPLVAMTYVGLTMGGPQQATPGMRLFSIRIVRIDGTPVDVTLAVVHAALFWIFNVMFTPLPLLISLFSEKKQLFQDMVLGTVVIRSDIA